MTQWLVSIDWKKRALQAERELDAATRLIAAIVDSQGGKLRIPSDSRCKALMDGLTLIRDDSDPLTADLVFRTVPAPNLKGNS